MDIIISPDSRKKEPPYGSTEGALKDSGCVHSPRKSSRTTIRLYRGSTERVIRKQIEETRKARTTIRLYRGSTESALVPADAIAERGNHHTALQREH